VPIAPNSRIFVVDDEAIISMTMAAILRRSGFAVTAFTNPLDCLAAAFCDRPDLLISDVIMPELSGIDLAVQIQQVCPDCGVLLVSAMLGAAYPMPGGEGTSQHFDLLPKPVHPVLLIHEVRRRLPRPAIT
jgi:DNA-binding NtrC family response regulator